LALTHRGGAASAVDCFASALAITIMSIRCTQSDVRGTRTSRGRTGGSAELVRCCSQNLVHRLHGSRQLRAKTRDTQELACSRRPAGRGTVDDPPALGWPWPIAFPAPNVRLVSRSIGSPPRRWRCGAANGAFASRR
jgi:hypothetical protein